MYHMCRGVAIVVASTFAGAALSFAKHTAAEEEHDPVSGQVPPSNWYASSPPSSSEPAASAAEPAPPSDWYVAGLLGGFGDSGGVGGLLVGATGLVRSGLFECGALLDGGAALFEYGYGGAAALGGIGI